MKKLLTILCLVLLVSLSTEVSFSQSNQEDCDLLCQMGMSNQTETQTKKTKTPKKEVLTGPFLIRGEITYDQKTNEPITGNIETFYDNGQLEQSYNYTIQKHSVTVE